MDTKFAKEALVFVIIFYFLGMWLGGTVVDVLGLEQWGQSGGLIASIAAVVIAFYVWKKSRKTVEKAVPI